MLDPSKISGDQDKRFTLSPEDIELLNPNTKTCPIFQSGCDAELNKAIYRRVPVLWREAVDDRTETNPWKLKFSQGLFNMASDSEHFWKAEKLQREGYNLKGNVYVGLKDRYFPLYEAKMLHQFDHRWATYERPDEARDVQLEESAIRVSWSSPATGCGKTWSSQRSRSILSRWPWPSRSDTVPVSSAYSPAGPLGIS